MGFFLQKGFTTKKILPKHILLAEFWWPVLKRVLRIILAKREFFMKTELLNELKNLRDQQNKIATKIGLLEELLSLDGHDVGAKVSKSTKRLTARSRTTGGEKQLKLPDLLQQIGQEHTAPMKYEVFAKFVQDSGYQTSASNLNNMVYQCLQKLVKKNIFKKNAESREYQYVGVLTDSNITSDHDDDFEDKPTTKKRA